MAFFNTTKWNPLTYLLRVKVLWACPISSKMICGSIFLTNPSCLCLEQIQGSCYPAYLVTKRYRKDICSTFWYTNCYTKVNYLYDYRVNILVKMPYRLYLIDWFSLRRALLYPVKRWGLKGEMFSKIMLSNIFVVGDLITASVCEHLSLIMFRHLFCNTKWFIFFLKSIIAIYK